VALLVGGCSPGGDDVPTAAPTSPAVDEEMEWAVHMKECLAEDGWEVRILEDGSITSDAPMADGGAYGEDFDAQVACNAIWEDM